MQAAASIIQVRAKWKGSAPKWHIPLPFACAQSYPSLMDLNAIADSAAPPRLVKRTELDDKVNGVRPHNRGRRTQCEYDYIASRILASFDLGQHPQSIVISGSFPLVRDGGMDLIVILDLRSVGGTIAKMFAGEC